MKMNRRWSQLRSQFFFRRRNSHRAAVLLLLCCCVTARANDVANSRASVGKSADRGNACATSIEDPGAIGD